MWQYERSSQTLEFQNYSIRAILLSVKETQETGWRLYKCSLRRLSVSGWDDDKGLMGLQEGVTEGQMNEKAADSRLL